MLKQHHKTNRLKFAGKYTKWTDERRKIIYSDEKNVIWSKRNFGGGSVMVWAAFSAIGKSRICFVSTKINSINYNELLEDALISFMDEDCNFKIGQR